MGISQWQTWCIVILSLIVINILMSKEEVINIIDERLSQLGLIKRDTNDKKEVSYNRAYMRDSWYND